MDLLTEIEVELANVLKLIQSTTTTPGGYTYYNDVTNTNLEDECIMIDRGDFPSIAIYQDPDEVVLSGEQAAYKNELKFKLVGSVSLDDIESDTPKFDINKKMNELLSDIKQVLSDNYNLNCTCDMVEITRSTRVYNIQADVFRAGDLIVYITVTYMQSRANVNNRCTY
jgi:hypothetical protein